MAIVIFLKISNEYNCLAKKETMHPSKETDEVAVCMASSLLEPIFLNLHSFSVESEVFISSLTFVIATGNIKFLAEVL